MDLLPDDLIARITEIAVRPVITIQRHFRRIFARHRIFERVGEITPNISKRARRQLEMSPGVRQGNAYFRAQYSRHIDRFGFYDGFDKYKHYG